jgi:alpha-tubulin suppressor-like RCC1 family protein
MLRFFYVRFVLVFWLFAFGVVYPAGAGTFSAMAAGYDHSCAVTSTGGVQCWGSNTYGQLGDGSTTRRLTPAAVSGLSSGVTAVVAGGYHSCALMNDGSVKCWGQNESGKLGDGTTANRLTPVAVSGLSSGINAIFLGVHHSCALTSAGAMKCWGDNSSGQLGDGTTTNRMTPINVTGLGSGVTAIAVGQYNTCAVVSGGARCWGLNEFGKLGDGTYTDRLIPTAVSGLSSGISSISTGFWHTCVVTTGGAAKCWGDNEFGELGDGTTVIKLTPVAVSGLSSGVSKIALGIQYSCALMTAGSVKCWGTNSSGQLGDGTQVDKLVPTVVTGLGSGVSALAGSLQGHSCVLASAGTAMCWGRNAEGELGDGSVISRLSPVAVISDSSAPSVPLGLTVTPVGTSQINLVWSPSTDNVGVTAYKIFRDGALIITLGNVTSFSNTGLGASTYYSYKVVACDLAGNCSAQSVAAAATTLAPDADGDGIPDASDNCPSIANSDQLNTDGDAQGNLCDLDDDNDGVPDVSDAFPLNVAESVDTDSDGIGNNADLDDDGDGVPDYIDAAPLNASIHTEKTLLLNGAYKGSSINENLKKL